MIKDLSDTRRHRGSVYRIWWLAGVVILLFAVREYFDAFLILYMGDLLNPKPAPLTAQLSDNVTLRLFGDTRPHIGKIDALQKGMVLVYHDNPLIEEGYGFGLPIIQRENQPYVASSAKITQPDDETLVKRFTIDTADRWSKFLQVKYQRIPSLGEVVVTYTIKTPDRIGVAVNLTGLNTNWDLAYMMNEQGARAFPIYEDSTGNLRHGDELGKWHADDDVFGCWLHRKKILRFCVQTESVGRRFVGRERYNQYNWAGIYTLSWSGIDIELSPPLSVYTYTIFVEEMGDK